MEKPYNFFGMVDKVYTLLNNGLNYSAGKGVLGFLLFTTLIVTGLPLVGVVTVPLWVLTAIEHIFCWVIDTTDDNLHKEGINKYLAITGIIIAFIPLITFFGPAIIRDKIKKRREKILERKREEYERLFEIAHHWVTNINIPPTRRIEKDFKPRKYLKPHNFGGRYVILTGSQSVTTRYLHIEGGMTTGQAYATGYHSIAIGSNSRVR